MFLIFSFSFCPFDGVYPERSRSAQDRLLPFALCFLLFLSHPHLAAEGDKECLCFLQILGIKAFGEPTVNLFEKIARVTRFVLLPPQPRQTHSRAQFEGLRLLATGDVDGLQKAFLWGG